MDTTSRELKPVIHIGYPKTGTKWFQTYYFPNLKDCFFLKRPEIFNLIIKPDIFEFSASKVKEELISLSRGKRIVVSEELLLGGLDIAFGIGEFINLMAQRLKLIFPEAIILIFIRNQLEVLQSTYSHYIKTGGNYSSTYFFGIKQHHPIFFKRHHLFSYKLFYYDRIINLYKSYYGDEDVTIFLFEDFLADKILFLDKLSKSISAVFDSEPPYNIIENRRLSAVSARLMRFFNWFSVKSTPFKNSLMNCYTFYYLNLSMAESLDKSKLINRYPYKLPKKVLNALRDLYVPSNNKLAEEVDPIKLKKYCYPL